MDGNPNWFRNNATTVHELRLDYEAATRIANDNVRHPKDARIFGLRKVNARRDRLYLLGLLGDTGPGWDLDYMS